MIRTCEADEEDDEPRSDPGRSPFWQRFEGIVRPVASQPNFLMAK
jgi:hypothetical protein